MIVNIAHHLPEMAALQPQKRAVVYPQSRDLAGRVAYTHLTFAQLDARANEIAWKLQGLGIGRGVRTLLLIRPNLDFIPVVFALFKIGATPILIDPGMGWCNLVHAAAEAKPEAFIGVPAAQILRRLTWRHFRSVKIAITLGSRWGWGGLALDRAESADAAIPAVKAPPPPFPLAATQADETAAILFTTGSTGPAKGVIYTHGIFDAQVRIIRDFYGITPDDIDLPCFPLFALFSVAMGVTAVIPAMDFTRPAQADPELIAEAIKNHGVTYSFGSPALWRPVSAWCAKHEVTLPSLRKVLMAGAPVPASVHECLLRQVLGAGAETHTPYGATEALPVCSFTGTEVLADTAAGTRSGAGICVGRPVPGVTLRIIRITDDAISEWDESRCLKPGEVGEIVVKGPIVTPAYFGLPEATARAKIKEGDDIWHRMGDAGYLDDRGRVWFCGRKSHRVSTAAGVLFTIPCEAVFNQHPDVSRSALVGISTGSGVQEPVIVIEPAKGKFPRTRGARNRFSKELLALGAGNPKTAGIRRVLFREVFPVDIRHNAKIRREDLATWAAGFKF